MKAQRTQSPLNANAAAHRYRAHGDVAQQRAHLIPRHRASFVMAQRRQPRTEDHHAGGRGSSHVHGGVATALPPCVTRSTEYSTGTTTKPPPKPNSTVVIPARAKEQKQKVHGGNRIVRGRNFTIGRAGLAVSRGLVNNPSLGHPLPCATYRWTPWMPWRARAGHRHRLPARHLARHPYAPARQVLYGMSRVMEVETDDGAWAIPPYSGVWIPAGKPTACGCRV